MNTSIKMKFLAAAILAMAASSSHALYLVGTDTCEHIYEYGLGSDIIETRECFSGKIKVLARMKYTIYGTGQKRAGSAYPWRDSSFKLRWVRESGLRDDFGSWSDHTGSGSRVIINNIDRVGQVWAQLKIHGYTAGWNDTKLVAKVDSNNAAN